MPVQFLKSFSSPQVYQNLIIHSKISKTIQPNEQIRRFWSRDNNKFKGICITKRPSDADMTSWRSSIKSIQLESNRVWTWAADSFTFRLPFEFNFAEVFSEVGNFFEPAQNLSIGFGFKIEMSIQDCHITTLLELITALSYNFMPFFIFVPSFILLK